VFNLLERLHRQAQGNMKSLVLGEIGKDILNGAKLREIDTAVLEPPLVVKKLPAGLRVREEILL
jgi:hypothetical protein